MNLDKMDYPKPDPTTPQFTIRAVGTGMVLGGALALCNVYLGLKIGWGMNMSIVAAILAYGLWHGVSGLSRGAISPFNKLENNINQTAASSAASISSAGLVAPIPALTMLTGYEWDLTTLVGWTFSVALVGVVVAVGLRKQALLVDKLAFPSGVAAGRTLIEMYAKGQEALIRVKVLLVSGVAAGLAKVTLIIYGIKKTYLTFISIPISLTKAKGVSALSGTNLGWALDPSPLFYAFGVIIGLRAGVSLIMGAIVGWLWLAPLAVENGWAATGPVDKFWFGPLIKWMTWPGVIMMVTAALTSFAFSWRSVLNAFRGASTDSVRLDDSDPVPRRTFHILVLVAMSLSVTTQVVFFDISLSLALIAVLLTFVLAVVAARVSGETGITPVGPMGKVTQLTFGALGGNVTANLMSANVTGGAASQCGDLLHDMKCGLMVGASPRLQTYAQIGGIMAGAIAGSLVYLILIPDPANQLLTDEWAAPAVAQWKAVAEILVKGFDNLPDGAAAAMLVAGVIGIGLAIAEKVMPTPVQRFIPSPSAIGLALVVPAYYAVAMFLGSVLGIVLEKAAPSWSKRFLIVVASGVFAGESLVGVGDALLNKVDWTQLSGALGF